jgi:CRP-like cAMP-binding protein
MLIESKVNEFEKGRMFGEIALIDQDKNQKRVLTAKAMSDCIIIKIPKEVFDMLLKERLKKERD